MKNKEILEEAAENHINNDLDLYESLVDGHISYNIGIDLLNNLFINGAKWMQKRMYSEEDMKIAWINGNNYHRGSLIDASQFTFEKTIEQFKKK